MANGSSTTTKSTGGEGPNSVWALIEEIKTELASHQFNAANAPAIAEIQRQLAEAQAGALRAYESHLSHGANSNAHKGGSLNGRAGAARLGGGGLAGPGSLGGFPNLGNVPAGTTGTTGTTSRLPIIIVLGAAGIGGYLLWHKLRVAHAQDKALDKGGKPVADAA